MRFATLVLSLMLLVTTTKAQKYEPIPFGDFQNWLSRDIEESFLLGGDLKRIYAIAPNGNVKGPVPYRRGVSPWSTSNALAIVTKITKTSNTVFPENRGGGNMCARLESGLVTCKVLGIVNISVMVCGSIFLGETIEPIRDANNPYTKLDMGIPFTKKPQALIFDYVTKIVTHGKITTAKGWSVKESPGADYAQAFVFLQNRTEHPDGSITAKRVGTAYEYITRSSHGWVNGHRLPIHYGDITGQKAYRSYMSLKSNYYAKNSKGRVVPVVETEWADADEPVTHVIVFFSSGHHEAFVGAIGNEFKIDNVKFEY